MFHDASNIWSFSQFFFRHRFLQCVILPTACFIFSVIFLAAILWIGFQTVLCTYFSEQILLGRLTQTLISENSPQAPVGRTMPSCVALELRSQRHSDLKGLEARSRLGKGLGIQLDDTYSVGSAKYTLTHYHWWYFHYTFVVWTLPILQIRSPSPREPHPGSQSSSMANWRPS